MFLFALICSLLSSLTFASAAGTVCVLDESLGSVSRKKFITIMLEKGGYTVKSSLEPDCMDTVQSIFLETAHRTAALGDLASFKWLKEQFPPSFFQGRLKKLCLLAMEGNHDDMLIYLVTEYQIQPFDLLLSACGSGMPKYIPKDSGKFSASEIETAAFACFFSGRPGAIHRVIENFKTRYPTLPNTAFDYAVAHGFPDFAEDLFDRHALKPDPAAIALAVYKRNEEALLFLLRRGLLVRPYKILPQFINEQFRVKHEVRARFDDKYDQKLPSATFILGLRGYKEYLDDLTTKNLFDLIQFSKSTITLGGLGLIHLAEMSLAGTTDSLLLSFLPLIANLKLPSAQRLIRSMNKKGATKESVIQSISKEALGHEQAQPE